MAPCRRPTIAEIGWQDIETDIPDVIAAGPWMEWHYDVVTVPAARHRAGPHRSRARRRGSWAACSARSSTPRCTKAMIRRWATGFGADELARIGQSPEELIATTQASVGASRANAERLVDWFCETIVAERIHERAKTLADLRRLGGGIGDATGLHHS